jgi:hypothetical protein
MAPQRAFKTLIWQYAVASENRTRLLGMFTDRSHAVRKAVQREDFDRIVLARHHRQKDRSHANALRRLGHRWLKIIHKMWMDRTLYDPELHHRNQLQHGSWIFQLKEC